MKNKFLTALIITFLSVKAFCQVADKTKLDKYFDALEANNKYMGSVALSKNGKTIYSRSTGYAEIEGKKKNNAATKFRIGSISKMFTATMVFKAIEENKLKLTDNLGTHFPTIANADKITIEHMLGHRSGIKNFTDDPLYTTWCNNPATEIEMIANMSEAGSEFEPGTKAQYSNSNYVLLSYILEKVYKKNFKELLSEKIVTPLKLTNTYYGGKINPAANEAFSYGFTGEWMKDLETDMSIPMGAGGILSTPEDLSRFIEAIFAGKVISPANLDRMKTLKDHYGLGMFDFPYDNKTLLGHNGNIDGFSAFVGYLPDDKITIAMTSNGANMFTNNISNIMLNWAFGKPFDIPEFKQYPYTTQELDQLIGIYANEQIQMQFIIATNGKELSAQASGQQAFPLESTEKNIFAFDLASIIITFNPQTKSFIIEQNGSSFTFVKKAN